MARHASSAAATVTPQPGMLDVHPVTIWYQHASVDDRTLLVTFASQGPPCEVLDRVDVDETETRVTITLYQGRDPDSDAGHPCDGPTRVVGVDVPLSRAYGPAPFSLAGITAERGDGAVINGGHLPEQQ